MIPVQINSAVKTLLPALRLVCLSCNISYQENNDELDAFIDEKSQALGQQLTSESIKQLPALQEARKAYKILGKDPSRYRLSAEALLRRMVQGKGIYRINNIVDSLNIVSAETGFSIGGYNLEKLNNSIELQKGTEGLPYEAIGRGKLNVANLPVLFDETGPFGSPTSDSKRTMVTEETNSFLMIFFDFGGDDAVYDAIKLSETYLTKYCNATNLETWSID